MGNWQGFWDLTYTGDNSVDLLDDPRTRLPERWTHDLSLSRSLSSGWVVGVDVRNLFDRRVRDIAGFPLPDRMLLLRLGWSGGRDNAS
jgi:outer membrane receptor protein involved in Fe transport